MPAPAVVPVAVTQDPTATSAAVPETVWLMVVDDVSVTFTLLVVGFGVLDELLDDLLFVFDFDLALDAVGRANVVDLTTRWSPETDTTGPFAIAKFSKLPPFGKRRVPLPLPPPFPKLGRGPFPKRNPPPPP
jgi:hypothetical protein